DHPQIRDQGSEGIIRNFRLSRRHRTDKGTLTGIRQAEQTNIGQHLQFQLEVTRITRLTRRGLPRRTVGTGLETSVTQTMPAALIAIWRLEATGIAVVH